MSSAIALRTPTLEWSHQSAQGELEGLSWYPGAVAKIGLLPNERPESLE